MTGVCIKLDKDAALFTDPGSEEAKFQNLLLNICGGLRWEHLSEEEKALCIKHGYNPDGKESRVLEPEWGIQK